MYTDPTRPKRDPKPAQKPNGYWYVLFYQRGKPSPKWVATGIQTEYREDWRSNIPDEVRSCVTDWARLWRDNRFDPWVDDKPGRLTASDAVERYLAERSRNTKSKETIKSLNTTLRPFADGLTPGLLISQVQPKHVRAFVTRPKLKPYTRNVYYNRLRTFFKWCKEKRLIYEDPTESINRPPEPKTTRTIFLPKDLERILEATRIDVGANPERAVCVDAYEFAAVTGMRRAELCSRTWRDVDLGRNLLRVDDNSFCGFTLKTDDSRRLIPLFPRAIKVLLRRQELRISEDPKEPIFLAPRHKQNAYLDADWLGRRFTEHRDLAGVDGSSIHALRHTFITYCLALGIPESKVMAMTGHTKFDTVKRYTHMVEELLQEAPDAALAKYLPGYESSRTPRLLQQIAAFMAGEKLPEPNGQLHVRLDHF